VPDAAAKTASTPSDKIDDLAVSADPSNSRKEAGRKIRQLDSILVKKVGDWGPHLFLKIIAGHIVINGSYERRPRVGAEVADPSKLRVDPFVAKRSPTGEVMAVFSTDPEKLKKRYETFELRSADKRQKFSTGRLEGNTVVFPGSQNVPDDALIVRQPYSFTGRALKADYLAAAEKYILGTQVIESLLRRNKSCTVGSAIEAGLKPSKGKAA
jgi:hypothetical protein